MKTVFSDFRDIDDEVLKRSGNLGVCRAYHKGQKLDYNLKIGDYAKLHSKLAKGTDEEISVKVKIIAFANGKVLGETEDNYYNPIPVGSKVSFSEDRIISASDI